jgi:hypothetical protein
MRYELGFYIPKDSIRHSHRPDNLKPSTINIVLQRIRPDAVNLKLADAAS